MTTPDHNSADMAFEWLSADFGYSVRVRRTLVDEQTPYQHLQVLKTPQFGNVLRLDGALQCSEGDEFFYHEPLVHLPAMLHTKPRTALVIGGGDGGSAEELLKHPSIEQVHLVEIDAQVIEASARYLRSVHGGLFDSPPSDKRFAWEVADGLKFIRDTTRKFDLIVLDLTDPGGPSSPLYSEDFYSLCASRLEEGGILSLHIAAPWSQQQRAASIVDRLWQVFGHVTPFLTNVPLSGGPWMMAYCAMTPQVFDYDSVVRRCQELRGMPLRYYSPAMHMSCITLPPYLISALNAAPMLLEREAAR